MPNRDSNSQELFLSKLDRSFRKNKRSIENEVFARKHKAEIERDLPQAEQFVLDFANQFLLPLTEEENNQTLQKLDVTDQKDIAVMRVLNDAFKLAKVNKLADVVEPQEVSGYEAAEGTRAFPNDMMFLNFRIEVGTDPLLGLADAFSNAAGEYFAQKTAERFHEPHLKYIIDEKGNTYTNQALDMVDPFGNLVAAESPSAQGDEVHLEHTEGELEEDKGSYDASVMIGWDLDHSLPVYIVVSGHQGLLGKGISLRFSFETDVEGATPFPLSPPKTNTSKVEFNPEHIEVTEEYTSYLEDYKEWYKSSERAVKLGNMQSKEQQLTVWGNNSNWNSFGSFTPNQESE